MTPAALLRILLRILLPLSVGTTVYLYLYPVFLGCALTSLEASRFYKEVGFRVRWDQGPEHEQLGRSRRTLEPPEELPVYPGGSGMPALFDLAGGGELSSATHFGVDIASCDMVLAMAHRLASHSDEATRRLGLLAVILKVAMRKGIKVARE